MVWKVTKLFQKYWSVLILCIQKRIGYENLPLRFRKAGRVLCGGTRETHWATCHNGVTLSKTKEFLKSPCFFRLMIWLFILIFFPFIENGSVFSKHHNGASYKILWNCLKQETERILEQACNFKCTSSYFLEALRYDSHAMTVLLDKDNHHATV